MKKGIWWVIGIIVIVIIVLVASKKPVESGPIKIGFIGPLTGDEAVVGEPVMNGIKLAEKEINDSGGIDGRLVSVIYEDGKCDGTAAASAAQKLVNVDKVKFIIDGVCSGEVLSTVPIVTAGKVLSISPGATSPKISGSSEYVFRNAPSDAARGVAIADLLSQSYNKPAVISEQTDFAQGLRDTFKVELEKKDLKLVADETFAANATDMRSMLIKIKGAQPDAVFLDSQTPAGLVRLANQARTLGIKAQLFSSEFNDETVTGAGSSTDGMIIAVAPGLSAEGKGKALLDAYKAAYGKDAAYAYYVGAAYDDLNLLVQGIKKVGEDSTKVRDYWRALTSYDGTIGTYSFDANGDPVGINFVFQKITGGKAVNM